MKPNYIYNKAILAALSFTFLVGMWGCQPEPHVKPQGTDLPSLEAQGPGDTVHDDPDPICGTPVYGDLVDNQGRTGSGNFFGPDQYGTWRLISTPSEMVLQITLNRGWFCSEYSVYMGTITTMPTTVNGAPDVENFPYNGSVRPVRNIWEYRWPIAQDMRCPNSVWNAVRITLCEIDFIGEPTNCANVWLGNSSSGQQVIGSSGAVAVSYCAESCVIAPPPCTVPAPAPGSDLSAYACGNGNGQPKVKVCHLPPGNPSNMQEICIAVSALDAHILEFKPLNNPCMGHHSGCHIGPCDPCGAGSTLANVPATDPCPGNGGNGGGNGRNR